MCYMRVNIKNIDFTDSIITVFIKNKVWLC